MTVNAALGHRGRCSVGRDVIPGPFSGKEFQSGRTAWVSRSPATACWLPLATLEVQICLPGRETGPVVGTAIGEQGGSDPDGGFLCFGGAGVDPRFVVVSVVRPGLGSGAARAL